MKTIIVAFFVSAIAITALETETTPARFAASVSSEFTKFTRSITNAEHQLISAEHHLEEKLEGGKNGIN